MSTILSKLCEKSKEAIETAARDSYNDGTNPDIYEGCSALVDLDKEAQIEVYQDKKGRYEVNIYHKSNNETPLIEAAIEDYLSENADPQGEWQDEYDNDDYRDVDPGCDPAFPHYGDFERWAYGNPARW